MKTRIVLLCALLSLSCDASETETSEARSVGPPSKERPASSRFKPEESAAVFVGVSEFPKDSGVLPVPYAVDDAVDLAYTFTFGTSANLIPPKRVVLALEGKPVKPESQARLEQLRAEGARVIEAHRSTILNALEEQAGAVGKDGLLVFAFASHGFSTDGTPYVLATDSQMENPASSLSTLNIADIAARAPRSVIFIDACRERQPSGIRAAGLMQYPSFAPLIAGLGKSRGQVLYYAAAAGQWAYEDFKRKNGVFTAAIIDTLQCQAARQARGLMTAQRLGELVDQRVLKWIRENRNPDATAGIQMNIEGASGKMPLARCTPPVTIQEVLKNGQVVTAIGTDDSTLWTKDMADPVVEAYVEDLDGDGMPEAVIGLHGTILAYDTEGERLWRAGTGDGNLTKFIVGNLYRTKQRQVVALSSDVQDRNAARLSIIDHEGTPLGNYRHHGPLHDVFVERLTSHHGPRIVVSGISAALNLPVIFMLEPKHVKGDAPPESRAWYGTTTNSVTSIEDVDCNNDHQVDIKVQTDGVDGCVDFQGQSMNPKFLFTLHSPKRASR